MRSSRATWVYARLVRFYPKSFRKEYGAEMVRLFGEQCRDAKDRGLTATAALWIRTAGDLAFSLIHEHIEERRGMSAHSILGFCGRNLTFGRLFATITICLVAACLLATLLMPKVYSGLARVDLRPLVTGPDPYWLQTAFEKIRSQRVLDPVIDDLNLTTVLAKEMGVPGPLSRAETREALLRRLELRQSRSTALVEMRVYSMRPELSASIANEIAESTKRTMGSQLVDAASPEKRPVRPNVPLNMVAGSFASVVVALVLAAVIRAMLREFAPVQSRA